MIQFSIVCAVLVVSVVGILFFSFRKHRTNDKESTLSRNTLLGFACLVPIAAIGLYFIVGTPQAIQTTSTKAVLAEKPMEGHDVDQMEQLVARLAQRLEKQPNDVEGWMLLARSYTVLGRDKEAKAALAKATQH